MKAFNVKWLPYLAAAYQAFQFAYAGSIYYGPTGWAIGGMAGIVVNIAVAIAASRISDISKTRRALAWTSLITVMVFSPIAVGPASYLSMAIIPVNWLRIITAAVWAIIPDASILLTGSITGKSLVHDENSQPKTQSESLSKASSRSAKGSRRSRSLSEIPCGFAGAGCDRKFASQNAANAHARTCKFKPTTVYVEPESAEKKG